MRIACVLLQRHGIISTGNPCPICRDEYLVLHPSVSDLCVHSTETTLGVSLMYLRLQRDIATHVQVIYGCL